MAMHNPQTIDRAAPTPLASSVGGSDQPNVEAKCWQKATTDHRSGRAHSPASAIGGIREAGESVCLRRESQIRRAVTSEE